MEEQRNNLRAAVVVVVVWGLRGSLALGGGD